MEEVRSIATEGTPAERLLNRSIRVRDILFISLLLFCLSPFVSPPIALLLGFLAALALGNPLAHVNKKVTRTLLQVSVVGLGFGMNVTGALKAGKEGFLFTIISITGSLVLGLCLGKLLKVEKKIAYLISTGTAICGGSAIAAVSPVIKAEEKQISVALATVFILNAVALLLFPIIGHALHLSQTQFGVWCAIAIHDTSSVVGAASKYGNEALSIATTIKLARALWIIPFAFLSTFWFKNKEKKIKLPYFIGLFILAIIANTYLPFIQPYSSSIVHIAKGGLTLTLFFIGSSLSKSLLATVGFKPLLLGVVLWIVVSLVSLWVILFV